MFRNIFSKPTDRLRAALEDARQRRPDAARAAVNLRTALSKESRETSEAGDTGLVCEAYRELALILLETGQSATAVSAIEELRNLSYGAAESMNAALALLEKPGLAEGDILKLGGWLREGGRGRDAISVLRTSLDERFRRSASLTLLLGDILLDSGDYTEAARRFGMVLDLRPDEGPALLPRFEKLAEVLPRDAITQQNLGRLYARQRQFPQAIQSLETALTLGEMEADLLFTLCDAYLETKNYARAVDVLERLYKQEANEAEVIRRCERLIEHYSESDWIYRRTVRLWGDVLRRQLRPEEALVQYHQSLLNLEPGEANLTFAKSLLERLLELEDQISQPALSDLHLVTALAYLVTGQPQESMQRCLEAVKSDRAAIPAAVDGLSRLTEEFPNFHPVRFELARLQMEQQDYPAALATLNRLRKDFPSLRHETIKDYKNLQNRLDAQKAGQPGADPKLLETLISALDAEAEETIEKDPAASLAALERILVLGGSTQASVVLRRLDELKLEEKLPLGGHLLQADANLAISEYGPALEACQQVPVSKDSLAKILDRLEQIIQKEAFPVHALLYAAGIHLDLHFLKEAITFSHRAYEADPATAANFILDRLEPIHRKHELPAEGLSLLSDALLLKPDAKLAGQLHSVLADLLKSSQYAAEVVEKVVRFQTVLAPESEVGFDFLLLLSDSRLVTGAAQEAVLALKEALLHPSLRMEDVLKRLETITSLENPPALGWLLLGDAILKIKKPDLQRANQAYRRALAADGAGTAGAVLERIPRISSKKGSPEAMAFLALKARGLAASGKFLEAAAEGKSILEEYGAQGVGEVLELADLLPDGADTWFLRAEAEINRGDYEAAALWMDEISQKAAEAQVKRAEASLQDWVERNPKEPVLQISHAIALNRLGRSDAASSELSEVTTRFPKARARAMELLTEIAKKAQNASAWLEMARGHLAQDDIAQTIQFLRQAWSEPGFAGKSYELLSQLAKKHPADPAVLRAMVELETLLGSEDSLQLAVQHGREWLAKETSSAADIAATLKEVVRQAGQSLPEGHDTALAARLVLADALMEADEPDETAEVLREILLLWPVKFTEVRMRAATWLKKQETLSMRLVLARAEIIGEDFPGAVESLQDLPYVAAEDLTALCVTAEELVEKSTAISPGVAAQAARLMAAWQAQMRALQPTIATAARAARIDPGSIPELLEWLAGSGWDAESQRVLDYTRAEICRQAGIGYFPAGLKIYTDLLAMDFELNEVDVQSGLKQFPTDFWPASQALLDIFPRLRVAEYPRILDEMDGMLNRFGAEHADEMLSCLDQMDATRPTVHLMRAKIYETCQKLDDASASLLHMQAEIPDALGEVEQAFEELIARHPKDYLVRIAYGDVEQKAEKWEAALQIYRAIQAESPAHIPALVGRYSDLLVQQPESCEIRWALAEAYRTLEQPTQAGLDLDQISDLEPDQEIAVLEFASGLVQKWPKTGAAWFVLGKLAFKKSETEAALKHLEQARQEGVPEECQVRLFDMLGRIYHRTGQLEKALPDLRQAVELAPQDALIRQELIDLRLSMLDGEIEKLRYNLDQHPADTQTALQLAELLLRRGKTSAAVKVMQPYVKDSTLQAQVHLELARCFAAGGQYHLAIGSLQAALKTGGLSAEERKEALYRLASANRRLMRFDEAIQALEEILVEDLDYLNAQTLLDEIQREKITARVEPSLLKPGSRYLPEENQGR